MLARYAAVEDFYLQHEDKHLVATFQEALLALYVSILEFQATAALYFSRGDLRRTIRTTVQADDWTKLLATVNSKDSICKDVISMLDIRDRVSKTNRFHDDLRRQDIKLDNILDSVQSIQKENIKILRWACDIQFRSDHDQIRHVLGTRYEDTCQWILPRVDEWLNATSPSFMWLHGTVGTGKSCAISTIVQHLSPPVVEHADHLVTYFYISKKRSGRNEPTEIFRCLATQMASLHREDSVPESLKTKYKERGPDRFSDGGELTFEECKQLMIEMSGCWTRSTLIIDALDECSTPLEVLDGLRDVCAQSSSKLKILASSRMNVEVPHYFPDCERLRIEEGQESGDLESYVRGEVLHAKRRLLDGKRPDLEERLMQILISRAHGMFIWVKLQLAVFLGSTRMRLSKDVIRSLDELEHNPALLETTALYGQIMDMNTRPGTLDRLYAIRALQWTMFALEELPPEAIAKAVSVDEHGESDDEVDGPMILEICSNLIVVDQSGCCRLAHVSVMGFLLQAEGADHQDGLFTAAEAHGQIAQRCLSFLVQHPPKAYSMDDILPFGAFRSYAVFHWALHCTKAGRHRRKEPLSSLFLSFMHPDPVSPAFATWSEAMSNLAMYNEAVTRNPEVGVGIGNNAKSGFRDHIFSMIANPPFPGFIASAFDFFEVLQSTPVTLLRSARGSYDEDCIYFATWYGRTEAMSVLIGLNVLDLSVRVSDSMTPLLVAAMLGYIDIVRILIDHLDKEEIITQDRKGRTALHQAAYYGRESIVETLLSKMDAKEVGLLERYGRTALQLGVLSRDTHIVQLLIQAMNQADIANRDKLGENALIYCCLQGESEMVRMLLSRMNVEDITLQDSDGSTALHIAACHAEEECVKLLVAHSRPEQLAITNLRKETPLHQCMIYSEQSPAAGQEYTSFQTIENIQTLLITQMSREDLGLQDSFGRTVLHLAAKRGSTRVLDALLQKIDVGQIPATDDIGHNCLHASVFGGDEAIVGRLSKYNALLEAKDQFGETPLAIAASLGLQQSASLPVLVANGANVNVLNNNNWSPLHVAASAGDGDTTSVLIDAGADINATTSTGFSVLHIDVREGNEDLLQLHLNAGADPNIQTTKGSAALTQAIAHHKPSMAQMLLSKGADPMLVDSTGRRCIDWAQSDPSLRDKINFGNHEIKPFERGVQELVMRKIIRDRIQEMLSSMSGTFSRSSPSYSRLGRCLMQYGDNDEAHIALLQAISLEPSTNRASHPAICDICNDEDHYIEGTRYVCHACVDTDLCSSCMKKYELGTLQGEICWGHDFMKVSSNEWEGLPEGKVNQVGETGEEWLRRLTDKYAEAE